MLKRILANALRLLLILSLSVLITPSIGYSIDKLEFKYLMKIGNTDGGIGDKEFDSPSDIEVDENGNIYIVDSGNNRVQVFDSKGRLLLKFGSKGKDNGQFNTPMGIALHPNGNIYISDTENDRIQIFSPKGIFLTKFGEAGGNNGQMNEPKGIAIDDYGIIHLVDSGNNRVQFYSDNGLYLGSIGSKGDEDGRFKEPVDITLDVDRNIYVTDLGNNRIQKFSPRMDGGKWIYNFPKTPDKNNKINPFGIVTDDRGLFYYMDMERCMLDVSNDLILNAQLLQSFGSMGIGPSQFKSPQGITTDDKGQLYIVDSKNNRTLIFEMIGRPEIKKEKTVPKNMIVINQVKTIDFYTDDLSLDKEGNLYLVNSKEHFIQILDSSLKPKLKFGNKGDKNKEFREPKGIEVTADGKIMVADTGNDRIQAFDQAGTYLFGFGGSGKEPGRFKEPVDLIVNEKGKIFVLDSGNNRIQLFNQDGGFLSNFGKGGKEEGQINEPMSLAFSADENSVYIANTANECVNLFDPITGYHLKKIKNDGKNEFNDPKGIFVDKENLIYVADTENDRIQILNLKGEYLMEFGSTGSGTKQLESPRGIAFEHSGQVYIYVADTGNNRIQVFTIKQVPDKPDKLKIASKKGETNLQWAKNKESFIKGYKIYQGSKKTDDYKYIGSTDNNHFTYNTNMNDDNYYYRISAEALGGLESEFSEPAFDYFAKGYNYYLEKNYDLAISQFKKVAISTEDTFYYLGMCYLKNKKFEEAANNFEKAKKKGFSEANLNYYLGISYVNISKFKEAAEALEEAKKAGINNPDIYQRLGEIYYRDKEYSKAIEEFKEAKKTNSKDSRLLLLLGSSYLNNGSYDLAETELKSTIVLDPASDKAYALLGSIYSLKGLYKEAAKAYNAAFKINPKEEYRDKIENIGKEQKKLKSNIVTMITPNDIIIDRFSNGILNLYIEENLKKKLINKTTVFFDALKSLGITNTGLPEDYSVQKSLDNLKLPRNTLQDQKAQAIDCLLLLASCLENADISTGIIFTSNDVLLIIDTGTPSKNINDMDIEKEYYLTTNGSVWIPLEAASLFKDSFLTSWKKGSNAYYKEAGGKNNLETILVRETWKTMKPVVPPPSDWKPIIPSKAKIDAILKEDLELYINKKFEFNVAKYKESIENDPTNAELRNRLGFLYLEKGMTDMASQEFKKGAEFDPQNMTARIQLGKIHLSRKQSGEAFNEFVKALKIDENNAETRYYLGFIYFEDKKYNDAANHLAEAIKLGLDEGWMADAQLKLGQSYGKINKFEEAIAEFESFIKMYPGHPSIPNVKKAIEVIKQNQSKK